MLGLWGVFSKDKQATEFPNTIYWTISTKLVTGSFQAHFLHLHELAAVDPLHSLGEHPGVPVSPGDLVAAQVRYYWQGGITSTVELVF